jgi:hypothetical protein
MKMAKEMVTVKGTNKNRTAIWDTDPAYKVLYPEQGQEKAQPDEPQNYQLFIGPDEIKTVPLTAGVEKALREGRLTKVSQQEAAEAKAGADAKNTTPGASKTEKK